MLTPIKPEVENAANAFALNYARKLVEDIRARIKGTPVAFAVPPQAWEAIQNEISARAKQCFLEGAELCQNCTGAV